MRVAILGVGRLGGTLVPLLRDAGVEVFPWTRGMPIPAGANAYWITTRDTAVFEVASFLSPDAVALHAAGAHGPELLGERADRGVLHPLMTFPGPAVGVPDLRGVGARVDGTPRAVEVATEIALRLGMRPFRVPGDTRAYHAAACLASGHLAALFLDAAGVLERAGVPRDEAASLLLPLAEESLRRVAASGPVALTGPAARDDRATERRHHEVLGAGEYTIYAALAARIRSLRGAR
ncbi:MAG: DUF2520 domain-containing protein [Myxococcota bacterium]